jgi:hypothetical protein
MVSVQLIHVNAAVEAEAKARMLVIAKKREIDEFFSEEWW